MFVNESKSRWKSGKDSNVLDPQKRHVYTSHKYSRKYSGNGRHNTNVPNARGGSKPRFFSPQDSYKSPKRNFGRGSPKVSPGRSFYKPKPEWDPSWDNPKEMKRGDIEKEREEEERLLSKHSIGLDHRGFLYSSSFENTSRKVSDAEKEVPLQQVKFLDTGRYSSGPQRAGIIPFSIFEGDLWFVFGCDSRSGDICDFGGSSDMRYDKDLVDTAVREYLEESYNAANVDIDRKHLDECYAIIDNSHGAMTMEIFCPVRGPLEDVFNNFHVSRQLDGPDREIEDIVVLSYEQIVTIINKTDIIPVYQKLAALLRRNLDYLSRLKEIYGDEDSLHKEYQPRKRAI